MLQHYVPQFLLKNFSHGKKRRLFVYDKSNDKCFCTNTKNIAGETGFYDIEGNDGIISMEPELSRIETRASVIIKKLIEKKNLQSLTNDERVTLAVFMAVQFLRTKAFRLETSYIFKEMTQWLCKNGIEAKQFNEIIGDLNTEQGHKRFTLEFLEKSKNSLAPYLLDKVWILLETTIRNPFYISDNPIGLYNELKSGPFRGNLGFDVKGIQIFLPISSTLCLNLLCRSIATEFLSSYDRHQLMKQILPYAIPPIPLIESFHAGVTEGISIPAATDNVLMCNHLQVGFSSRYVFCETDNFRLVREMIKDNQQYREGHRPAIN